MFLGREKELKELKSLYDQNCFQLFVLYGRRRVGKTSLLREFCKDKKSIFFAAEQSNEKLNLEKFSTLVFQYYNESTLEPFTSWENALLYIDNRQLEEPLVLVFDEFPYLANINPTILSVLQHLIDHKLQFGKLFLILCGSYMGFMEKEVLGSKSPLFGRRTAQLHMKPFDYRTSIQFVDGFSDEEKLMLYGAFGGTAMYLKQIQSSKSLKENILHNFLNPMGYLYEEPLLLLRQEVQEPGVYCAIIEAIAGGASKSNEIATKTGEEAAKCLKYIKTLQELGIVEKETPFGEKDSSRRTLYALSDFMFRFWYRYVSGNRSLLEMNAGEIVWKRKIESDYSHYMGLVFERACRDYLLYQNSLGNLPILFTESGRWWGSNSQSKDHEQVEIDLVARDGRDYLICECKWRNEPLEYSVLSSLRRKADIMNHNREHTWFVLFSKSGFSSAIMEAARQEDDVILVSLQDMLNT